MKWLLPILGVLSVETACFAVSIDGYGAGPGQAMQNPFGVSASSFAVRPGESLCAADSRMKLQRRCCERPPVRISLIKRTRLGWEF
jgi:hypothetical protein